MTTKIIAPLKLENEEVYSIEELRNNITLLHLMKYCWDSKEEAEKRRRLLFWLKIHGDEEIVKKLDALQNLPQDDDFLLNWTTQIAEILQLSQRKVLTLKIITPPSSGEAWTELILKTEKEDLDLSKQFLQGIPEGFSERFEQMKKNVKEFVENNKKIIPVDILLAPSANTESPAQEQPQSPEESAPIIKKKKSRPSRLINSVVYTYDQLCDAILADAERITITGSLANDVKELLSVNSTAWKMGISAFVSMMALPVIGVTVPAGLVMIFGAKASKCAFFLFKRTGGFNLLHRIKTYRVVEYSPDYLIITNE